jgi:hypothetical protein
MISCPEKSRNRDPTAILEFLEHRRLECAAKLDDVIRDVDSRWCKLDEEERKKNIVSLVKEGEESYWHEIGIVIVRDIWQTLYVSLESMLTVGTTKYQTLDDTTIWKIVAEEKREKKNLLNEKVEEEKQRTKTKKSSKESKKESSNASSNQASIAPTPPLSPRSSQRLVDLATLETQVEEMIERVNMVEHGLVFERTSSLSYAEHDALLSQPRLSFVPARRELTKLRWSHWTDLLAQTYGDLERIQCTKVDAIMTADLETGRLVAKERRKKLTKMITILLDRVVQVRKNVESEKNSGLR